MASRDKLLKAFETLRSSMLNTQNTDLTAKKKEKIVNCSIVADILCNTNIKTLPNFPNSLSASIELFLKLCDDSDSDVRMMADECLNRVIRSAIDGHVSKIQVELQKAIRQNGSARSVRAALSRFAQLCHMIRPFKGQLFVPILVPCIVTIAGRKEEAVLETLEHSLTKIMGSLGCFASDNQIKSLLRAFLQNISNNSAAVRRTAANSLITICLNCRKPNVFITYILNSILDMVVPVRETNTIQLLLGAFNCLRCLIPHANIEESNEQIQGSFGSMRKNSQTTASAAGPPGGDRFVQIYELCLYYVMHSDHNVINAALETLHTLLVHPGKYLLETLLSPKGISRSRITPLDGHILKMRSMSEMSVAVSDAPTESENFLLSSVSEKLSAPDVEKWIETSKLTHNDFKEVDHHQQLVDIQLDSLSLNNYYEDQTEEPSGAVNRADEYSNLFIRNINDNESEISNSTNRDSTNEFLNDYNREPAKFTDRLSVKSNDDLVDANRSPVPQSIDVCPLKEDLNIGEFTDEDVPLVYCCRHLVKLFLLTGYPRQLMPDSLVRVSVKSLALTCVSRIVQLYPDIMVLYLDKSAKSMNINELEQPIADLLLFGTHSDQQIRGIVRILIGSLIKSVLLSNSANYENWLNKWLVDGTSGAEEIQKSYLHLDSLVNILNKGLEDESSTCTKQSLAALQICLVDLLESANSKSALSLLNSLPAIVKNPYWLVQVQLVEVLQELPYITIYHVTKNSEFQDKVLNNVIYYLLGNHDMRVRNSTARALVRIIPKLYFQKDHPQNIPVTAKAVEYRLRYMDKLFVLNTQFNINQRYFISSMPSPFAALGGDHHQEHDDRLEKTLSRIISYLKMQLLQSNSKYLTFGCCEALALLSNEYQTTIYNKAWTCVNVAKKSNNNTKLASFQRTNSQNIDTSLLTVVNESNMTSSTSCASGLLNICVSLMSNSVLSEDISCQNWLLNLAGNIFSGISIQNLRPLETLNQEPNQLRKNWDFYADPIFVQIVEQLLSHVIKMLSIFTHVVDETQPVQPTAKTTLPSLPNATSLSPMKRNKNKPDVVVDKNKIISPAKTDKDDKSEKKSESTKFHTMGYFANNPHYMKIFEILKTAYGNYKITLDENASEKFLKLLKTVLATLSQILEMCTIQECGRVAEEILHYLQSCVTYEPAGSIQCVQQLLKSLFGTNLCTQLEELDLQMNKKQMKIPTNKLNINKNSFYTNVFQQGYSKFTNCINVMSLNKQRNNIEDCAPGMLHGGYMRRKSERKSSLTLKSLTRGVDKTILANYIRLFEPMVIKSLKQYTATTDIYLQCRVLQLLSQLVQLRVNYCLLDSDQIFIGFVLKQFEYLEEGQIPHAEELIPKIFQFLVHLSYENQHSKRIIVIPKVINLCDRLMASGQSPVTHCIPALKPVIYDIFLHRGVSTTSDNNSTIELEELETTRDVLFSMLLRLVEYHQVLEMLTLIVGDSRYDNNGERWIKWSKLVVDSIVPMLMQRRVCLETRQAQIALHSLLCELHPNVYKAMDPLLLVLFQDPPYAESSLLVMHRWLGSILSILLTISSIREEILLVKINDIRMDVPVRSVYSKLVENYDPLNVTSSAQSIHNIPSEEIFARFLFRIFHIVSEKCLQLITSPAVAPGSGDIQYLLEQFSAFLMFAIYMFESGSHCKIANTAMNLIYNPSSDNLIPIDEINLNFLKLSPVVPTLTFQWCYILTLLGYSNQKFWSKILQNVENNKIIHLESEKLQTKRNYDCINLETVRQGGIILYSDYICENITDCENLTWFLVNHIESVINLSNEPPVAELVAAIHRNSAASGLFVQAIAARCHHFEQPNFVNKLLRCLENVHPSQSGPLLVFLVPNLLNCRQLALSRLNAGLASRRTEMLLTMTNEEVTSQLSKEDLTIIMEILLERKLAKKHGTFVSLLNKLASKYYDLSPLELDQGRIVNPESIRKIVTNKAWYLSQVKLRCCQSCYLGPESAELLNKLSYDEIVSIMAQKDFNRLILKDCITLVAQSIELANEGGGLEMSPLLKATVEILMKQIVYIKSLMPKPHQVYNVVNRNFTPAETKYTNRLNELFTDNIFWNRFFEIIPSVSHYLNLLSRTKSKQPIIAESNYEDILKFSVLALESIVYSLKQVQYNYSMLELNSIELALQCANSVLRQNFLTNILALDSHATWLCSAINAIFALVSHFLLNMEPMPTLSKYGLRKTFDNIETQSAANACYQLATLVAWLEQLEKKSTHSIPESIFALVRSLIISLARLPLVNSFVLTPPDVWDQMWQIELGGTFNTHVPLLPIELLQEIEVLEQFIFRVTLLGWTSRQQFEETWMCLLCVLSSSKDEEQHVEDVSVTMQVNSLVVQAITSLLMQTLLIPVPGHPNYSQYLHIPREKILNQTSLSTKKLISVQNKLYWRYKQCTNLPDINLANIYDRPNLDRVHQNCNKYTYGQVSVQYLWAAANVLDTQSASVSLKITDLLEKRQNSLEQIGLDIHSCLQFLLDLYSQWIRPQNGISLRLLNEVIRSILAISDLFTEKKQFQWMLDTCLELSKRHPVEDEIFHQYIVLGVCKAAATLIPDMEVLETVKKLVENSLKSSFLPERVASLHGILYLLESSVMSNTVIGGMSDEMLLIHPIAIDYIQSYITANNKTLCQSEDHRQVMWALAFYLLEHVEDQIADTEIVPNVLQVVMVLISQNSQISMALHNTLLQGLERLIVAKSITGNVVEQVTKLAVERLKHPNPGYAFPALQLLLTCMYTEAEKQIDTPENVNGIVQMDPDLLVEGIEKISAIFDRIKKGYPFEAELLCTVLPHILNDFFPPSEILTKVIGEFLSTQQPHPKLLSNVVFQVFERASNQNQLTLLQDWVVFSLSNFTQCLPIGMATWCLICFFISASTNQWLRALFPHVQSRIGKYEYEDKKMLCVAGADFYRQLTSDAQKRKFVETFQAVVDTPGTPFKDLLQSLL